MNKSIFHLILPSLYSSRRSYFAWYHSTKEYEGYSLIPCTTTTSTTTATSTSTSILIISGANPTTTITIDLCQYRGTYTNIVCLRGQYIYDYAMHAHYY